MTVRRPPSTNEVEASTEITAVVDTNVLLDFFSCHDMWNTYERVADRIGSEEAIYRRARARESLLLAVHLHRLGATTLSAREALRIIETCVDPDAEAEFTTHFTTFVIYFVRDYLLPGWEITVPTEDDDLRGSAVDAWLLDFAREHGLPLITNEGSTTTGVQPTGLRAAALDAGVPVFTPGEFWAGHLDATEASCWLIEHFGLHAPTYLQTHPHPDAARESLLWMDAYYRHVLLGETPVQPGPLVVEVR